MTIFNFGTKTRERFIKDTIAKMEKSGYKCTLKGEDVLLIMAGEVRVFAKMWGTPDKGRWRVNFAQKVELAGADKMSDEGAAVFVAACNNSTEYTVAQFLEQEFFCHVMTNVGSASDFVREFEFATSQIDKTSDAMSENLPIFVKSFPKLPPRRPIGFIVPNDNVSAHEDSLLSAWHQPNIK